MSRASRPRTGERISEEERQALSTFLRVLAARAEDDEDLAAHLIAALRESELLATQGTMPAPRETSKRTTSPSKAAASDGTVAAPDPFALLRGRGEDGLRAALQGLELAALRQLVRAYHLDPARISARWTARDRVITLIVSQVQARANHGKAFARV